MAKGNARDLQKERQWRQWLREWRSSGGSVREFCARRGLAEASFYGWRRELAKRDGARAAFVPVHVVAEAAPPARVLEVVLSGGRTVRVSPGFDAATLRQVLAVLEERPPC